MNSFSALITLSAKGGAGGDGGEGGKGQDGGIGGPEAMEWIANWDDMAETVGQAVTAALVAPGAGR